VLLALELLCALGKLFSNEVAIDRVIPKFPTCAPLLITGTCRTCNVPYPLAVSLLDRQCR